MRPENAEFIALCEVSGWTQAEISRRLHKEPPVISRWKSGQHPADKTAVELFKFLLAHEKPDALTAITMKEESLAEWERRMLQDLRWLHEDDRQHVLKVMKTLIQTLPERKAIKYPRLSSSSREKPRGSGRKRLDPLVEALKRGTPGE